MSCLGWWWKAEGIGCQSWLKLLVKRSQKYKCYQIFLLFKTFREGDGGRMAEFFAAGSFDSLRPVGRGASSRARRGIMLSGWIGISVNMCKRWFGNQHQPPDNSDWAMAPLLVDQAFVGTVSWRMLHHAAPCCMLCPSRLAFSFSGCFLAVDRVLFHAFHFYLNWISIFGLVISITMF